MRKSRLNSLLESCRPSKLKIRARSWNWHRLMVSFWSCISFVGLGASLLVFGPTLLDIADNLSVDVGVLSVMFTCRAIGAVIGSVSSGVIIDKYYSFSYTILSVIIASCIATTAVLPLSVHVAMLGAFMFLNGIATGGLDNGVHAVLMPLWGKKSGPCMQILHFSWAFGAFIAPLIAKHFIQEQQETDLPEYNITCLEVPTHLPGSIANSECFQLFNETCKNLTWTAPVDSKMELSYADFNCTTNSNNEPSTQFIYAYFITAALYLPSLAAFVYYAVRRHCFQKCRFKEAIVQKETSSDPSAAETESESSSNGYPLCYIITLFTLIFCFMFLYVGLEAGFGSLIFTVAVKGKLNFFKPTAAVLQSVFWGTFAFTRLVSVTLAILKVRASIMIMGNLFGSFVASLIMTFYIHNSLAIWIGSAVLGMSYASIFPTVMTWMSENAKATGKATAVLVTGGTIGDITIPATLAALVASVNPDTLIYATFGGVIVSAGIAGLMFLTACLQKRRQEYGAAQYKRLTRMPLEELNGTSENNYCVGGDTNHIGDLNSGMHVNNSSVIMDRESESTAL